MAGNPDPPERRTTRASEKAKTDAEAVGKQQLVDNFRGLLMTGKGETLNPSPGVLHDKNRRELDEILARKNAGLLELSPSSVGEEEDSSEEEQAAVKEEVVEDGEESQELGNLLTGQGDLRVKTETDLLEQMEIKTEEQCSLGEENTGEQKLYQLNFKVYEN